MGSGFDDWVYWYFFTIAVDYITAHTFELPLNDVCLTNPSLLPESRTGLYYSPIESESYVTTDGQPASLSWNKTPFWGLRPDLYYCLTVEGFVDLGRPL
jgi:hypothetical protein